MGARVLGYRIPLAPEMAYRRFIVCRVPDASLFFGYALSFDLDVENPRVTGDELLLGATAYFLVILPPFFRAGPEPARGAVFRLGRH